MNQRKNQLCSTLSHVQEWWTDLNQCQRFFDNLVHTVVIREIFLPFRFYVKSILTNTQLGVWNFEIFWVWGFQGSVKPDLYKSIPKM